jgi:SET domain-containing protein
MGLIARQRIPCGTVIWKLEPLFDRIIPCDLLPMLSESARAQLRYYAAYYAEKGLFVLSSDDDRFSNHSDTPNTRDFGDYYVAAQDIEPGEEITQDYRKLGLWPFPPSPYTQAAHESLSPAVPA